MGKFTRGIKKIVRGVRRASTVTFDVLFAHPDADRTSPEIPSFYLVQTSPTSLQQRYITPRSSATPSSTTTLVVRNPDPSPERSLRSAEDLLPDGEITAESFELQITDEEADNEPNQEEFGNNVEEPSPQPESRPRSPSIFSTQLFPRSTADLNRNSLGYRYEVPANKPQPRLEVPPNTYGNRKNLGNDARNDELHYRPSPVESTATGLPNSASGNRNQRPQLVVIPKVRFGRHLPESLRVPERALSQDELKAIRKAEFQLIPTKPLAQRLTGGLDYRKALAEMKQDFKRVSRADFQLIPRKSLAQRWTGGVAYKKALAEMKQRHRRPELPVRHPSHHSHRSTTPIAELPAETLSSQLPGLWSPTPRNRSLVVRGNTVTFDGAYHTYMYYRRQTRQRRYLERVLEGWGRKFEKKTSLAQEIAEALAELGTFGNTS